MRTKARHSPSKKWGTLRKRDLGGLGGNGRNGFTPEERSAHLLNFCRRVFARVGGVGGGRYRGDDVSGRGGGGVREGEGE